MVKTKVAGLGVNYDIYGNGPVLVLLHGWGVDSTIWQEMVGDLSKNLKIVTIDLPGFGQSDASKTGWSLKKYAQAVAFLLAKLGAKKFHLLGHSFGGRVAIAMAADENLSKNLAKLILVDSAGIKKYKSPWVNLVYFLAKGGGMLFNLKLLKKLAPTGRKFLYRVIGEHDYERAGNLKSTFINIINEDLTGDLPKIRNKTLVVWGENDQVTPVNDAYQMKKLINGSELVIIPGCGHFPFVDRPLDFIKVVGDFLR